MSGTTPSISTRTNTPLPEQPDSTGIGVATEGTPETSTSVAGGSSEGSLGTQKRGRAASQQLGLANPQAGPTSILTREVSPPATGQARFDVDALRLRIDHFRNDFLNRETLSAEKLLQSRTERQQLQRLRNQLARRLSANPAQRVQQLRILLHCDRTLLAFHRKFQRQLGEGEAVFEENNAPLIANVRRDEELLRSLRDQSSERAHNPSVSLRERITAIRIAHEIDVKLNLGNEHAQDLATWFSLVQAAGETDLSDEQRFNDLGEIMRGLHALRQRRYNERSNEIHAEHSTGWAEYLGGAGLFVAPLLAVPGYIGYRAYDALSENSSEAAPRLTVSEAELTRRMGTVRHSLLQVLPRVTQANTHAITHDLDQLVRARPGDAAEGAEGVFRFLSVEGIRNWERQPQTQRHAMEVLQEVIANHVAQGHLIPTFLANPHHTVRLGGHENPLSQYLSLQNGRVVYSQAFQNLSVQQQARVLNRVNDLVLVESAPQGSLQRNFHSAHLAISEGHLLQGQRDLAVFLRASQNNPDPEIIELRHQALGINRQCLNQSLNQIDSRNEALFTQRQENLENSNPQGAFATRQAMIQEMRRVINDESSEIYTIDQALEIVRTQAQTRAAQNPVIPEGVFAVVTPRMLATRDIPRDQVASTEQSFDRHPAGEMAGVPTIELNGGVLEYRPLDLGQGDGPVRMVRVRVGTAGGVIHLQNTGYYRFEPSDRAQWVLLSPSACRLPGGDSPSNLSRHAAHLPENLLRPDWFDADNPFYWHEIAQLFDADGRIHDEPLRTVVAFEGESSIRRRAEGNDADRRLQLELAQNLRQRNGSYAAAAQIFEELMDPELRRIQRQLTPTELRTIDRQVEEHRHEIINRIHHEVTHADIRPTQQQVDQMIQRALDETRVSLTRRLEFQKLKQRIENGQVTDPLIRAAWEQFNDMEDPTDEWFNLADSSIDRIVDQVIMEVAMLPLTILSGGVASLAEGGAQLVATTAVRGWLTREGVNFVGRRMALWAGEEGARGVMGRVGMRLMGAAAQESAQRVLARLGIWTAGKIANGATFELTMRVLQSAFLGQEGLFDDPEEVARAMGMSILMMASIDLGNRVWGGVARRIGVAPEEVARMTGISERERMLRLRINYAGQLSTEAAMFTAVGFANAVIFGGELPQGELPVQFLENVWTILKLRTGGHLMGMATGHAMERWQQRLMEKIHTEHQAAMAPETRHDTEPEEPVAEVIHLPLQERAGRIGTLAASGLALAACNPSSHDLASSAPLAVFGVLATGAALTLTPESRSAVRGLYQHASQRMQVLFSGALRVLKPWARTTWEQTLFELGDPAAEGPPPVLVRALRVPVVLGERAFDVGARWVDRGFNYLERMAEDLRRTADQALATEQILATELPQAARTGQALRGVETVQEVIEELSDADIEFISPEGVATARSAVPPPFEVSSEVRPTAPSPAPAAPPPIVGESRLRSASRHIRAAWAHDALAHPELRDAVQGAKAQLRRIQEAYAGAADPQSLMRYRAAMVEVMEAFREARQEILSRETHPAEDTHVDIRPPTQSDGQSGQGQGEGHHSPDSTLEEIEYLARDGVHTPFRDAAREAQGRLEGLQPNSPEFFRVLENYRREHNRVARGFSMGYRRALTHFMGFMESREMRRRFPGVRVEQRPKDPAQIGPKVSQRRNKGWTDLSEFFDINGARIVVQNRSEAEALRRYIAEWARAEGEDFLLLESEVEDIHNDRGYAALHLNLRMRMNLPGESGYRPALEIQIQTEATHRWEAIQRELVYKNRDNQAIPSEVRQALGEYCTRAGDYLYWMENLINPSQVRAGRSGIEVVSPPERPTREHLDLTAIQDPQVRRRVAAEIENMENLVGEFEGRYTNRQAEARETRNVQSPEYSDTDVVEIESPLQVRSSSEDPANNHYWAEDPDGISIPEKANHLSLPIGSDQQPLYDHAIALLGNETLHERLYEANSPRNPEGRTLAHRALSLLQLIRASVSEIAQSSRWYDRNAYDLENLREIEEENLEKIRKVDEELAEDIEMALQRNDLAEINDLRRSSQAEDQNLGELIEEIHDARAVTIQAGHEEHWIHDNLADLQNRVEALNQTLAELGITPEEIATMAEKTRLPQAADSEAVEDHRTSGPPNQRKTQPARPRRRGATPEIPTIPPAPKVPAEGAIFFQAPREDTAAEGPLPARYEEATRNEIPLSRQRLATTHDTQIDLRPASHREDQSRQSQGEGRGSRGDEEVMELLEADLEEVQETRGASPSEETLKTGLTGGALILPVADFLHGAGQHHTVTEVLGCLATVALVGGIAAFFSRGKAAKGSTRESLGRTIDGLVDGIAGLFGGSRSRTTPPENTEAAPSPPSAPPSLPPLPGHLNNRQPLVVGQIYSLGRGLGDGRYPHLSVDDRRVSRQHARARRNSDGTLTVLYLAHDAANGSSIIKKRVTLQPGESFGLGVRNGDIELILNQDGTLQILNHEECVNQHAPQRPPRGTREPEAEATSPFHHLPPSQEEITQPLVRINIPSSPEASSRPRRDARFHLEKEVAGIPIPLPAGNEVLAPRIYTVNPEQGVSLHRLPDMSVIEIWDGDAQRHGEMPESTLPQLLVSPPEKSGHARNCKRCWSKPQRAGDY